MTGVAVKRHSVWLLSVKPLSQPQNSGQGSIKKGAVTAEAILGITEYLTAHSGTAASAYGEIGTISAERGKLAGARAERGLHRRFIEEAEIIYLKISG